MALGVAAINQAIKEGKAAQTERVLRNPAVALRGVVPACAAGYQRVLEGAVAEKRRPGNRLGNAPLTRLCPPGCLRPRRASSAHWRLCRGHSFLGST